MATVQKENEGQAPAAEGNSWSQCDDGQQETDMGFCQVFIKEEVHELDEAGGCSEEPEVNPLEVTEWSTPIFLAGHEIGAETFGQSSQNDNYISSGAISELTVAGSGNDLLTHENPKPHSCAYCSYASARRPDLIRHTKKIHPSEQLPVESEPRKPRTRKRKGRKTYVCEICDYTCNRSVDLKRHLRAHTGEKPFTCEFCDFKTCYSCNLKTHLKTHKDDKPFSCEFCDFKTCYAGNLKTHLRTHSGDKLYNCEFCDYKSSFSSNLKKHVRTHTGEQPVSCEFCQRKFYNLGDMNRHLETHADEKPLSC